MKLLNTFFAILIALLFMFPSAGLSAADFDWTKDFNIKAEADPAGFRVRLAARFQIGEAEIEVVLGKVGKPADAYLVFRLGEMSAKPTDYVLEKYRGEKKKGWGALAKSLGIKPGSKEFHALKSGDDLYQDKNKGQSSGKSKGKNKN